MLAKSDKHESTMAEKNGLLKGLMKTTAKGLLIGYTVINIFGALSYEGYDSYVYYCRIKGERPFLTEEKYYDAYNKGFDNIRTKIVVPALYFQLKQDYENFVERRDKEREYLRGIKYA